MPNWVSNNLSLHSNNPEMTARIIEEVRGSEKQPLSFQRIMPKPDDVEDWYQWQIEHWGTKWDMYDGTTVDTSDPLAVHYFFETAWSPPIPIVYKLSALYHDVTVTISYLEEQGWGGELTLRNGEIIAEKSWDIPESHAELSGHGGECFCEIDNTYVFTDCCLIRMLKVAVSRDITLSKDDLDIAEGLSLDWQGTPESLLDTTLAVLSESSR